MAACAYRDRDLHAGTQLPAGEFQVLEAVHVTNGAPVAPALKLLSQVAVQRAFTKVAGQAKVAFPTAGGGMVHAAAVQHSSMTHREQGLTSHVSVVGEGRSDQRQAS